MGVESDVGEVEGQRFEVRHVERDLCTAVAVEVSHLEPLHLDLTDVGLDAHPFLMTRWQGSPTNAAPDEHDDLGWFPAADLGGLRLARRHYQAWLPTLLAGRAPGGLTGRPAGAGGVVDE